ncbi:PRKR-interacting protein 1 homolog [Penaeus japonicus]|uniref:PRKR-interacting protein 1 homolog n=1 Tax=Penaeus japonicus TaxID=27405 RepID=UPI001C713380|nr:PRKR-interacting protein 1 homolog [Penaeus japonicus]
MSDTEKKGSSESQVTVVRNATDLQRLKLEKLMKNAEKLAFIPDRPKDKKFSDPAEFVRNVMGSSAGAGSGEFHVYRHIRRREYARQEFLNQMKEKDYQNYEYHMKIEENRQALEAKTAKKRAKRQRQKEKQAAKRQKMKEAKKKGITIERQSSSSESSEEEEEEEEEKEKEKEERMREEDKEERVKEGEETKGDGKKEGEKDKECGDSKQQEKEDEGEKSKMKDESEEQRKEKLEKEDGKGDV